VKSEGPGSDPPAGVERLAAKGDRGSHRQFLHPEKGLVVTVAGHPGKDVPIGTLKAILRSAGVGRKEEDR